MPLLDHFRPPVTDRLPWPSFFNGWACGIADVLNGPHLPEEYVAHQFVTLHGHTEVDSRSYDEPLLVDPGAPGWLPAGADQSHPIMFPECVEVRVRPAAFPEYKAVVVLVAPGNKETPAGRIGLAARCVGYLQTGVAVALVDVVTTSEGNVHHEVMRLLGVDPISLPVLGALYAVSYRPAERRAGTQLDIWTYPLALGDPLPTMPLRLVADYFVPVELELTYTEACRRRRLIP